MKKEKVENLKNQHEKKDGQGSFGMVKNLGETTTTIRNRKKMVTRRKKLKRAKNKRFSRPSLRKS